MALCRKRETHCADQAKPIGLCRAGLHVSQIAHHSPNACMRDRELRLPCNLLWLAVPSCAEAQPAQLQMMNPLQAEVVCLCCAVLCCAVLCHHITVYIAATPDTLRSRCSMFTHRPHMLNPHQPQHNMLFLGSPHQVIGDSQAAM